MGIDLTEPGGAWPEPIIDCHAHVCLRRADGDRRDLLDALATVPLAGIWVTGYNTENPTPEENIRINNEVRVLMRLSPLVEGFVYLNPRHGKQALAELERCRSAGFAGIKLWIDGRADDPAQFPIYEAAIRWRMPILVHSFDSALNPPGRYTEAAHLAEAARRFPECTFIMAHLSGDFIIGMQAVRELNNVYTDFSGSVGENGAVDYAVAELGARRVLFGTDMPGIADVYHNLGKVLGARLSDEERALILYQNAQRILP